MARFGAGCTALLALAFVAACAKDSPSGGEQIAAPDASVDAPSLNGSSSDRDSDGPSGGRFIAMVDDCDPADLNWNTVPGGCKLRRGNVTLAEFNGENISPFVASVVGHQAWQNAPTYLVIKVGRTVRVKNEGGRPHTFTEVKNYHRGKAPAPPLNHGLLPSPENECATSTDILPGESVRISGLQAGNHRFQCCFHPWMRAIIKVKAN